MSGAVISMDENLLNLIKTMIAKESNTDSIEIGTPSKGGVLKVYFNANNPEEAEAKINKGMVSLEFARAMYNREIKHD